jgi:AbrB family looped-hinge helix DNA binding protein
MSRTYYTSSVSQKGQITLPAELRRELDIEPKDIVVIALEDGKIQVETAKSRLHAVYQSVPALDPPRDWSEITKIAWDDFAERNARTGLHDEERE